MSSSYTCVSLFLFRNPTDMVVVCGEREGGMRLELGISLSSRQLGSGKILASFALSLF